MKKYAVLVAGGNGTRMGSSLPKQYLYLSDQPILLHTLKTFIAAYQDIHIILVLPEAYVDYTKEIFSENNFQYPVTYVIGGETRFHSVQNGLKTISDEGIVFVHDAVRCLVSADLIRRCYDQAIEKGSAIPVVTMKDSVRMVDENNMNYAVSRNKLRLVQTPQTFQTEILLPSFECTYQESFTDEATVVEAHGQKVFLIEGEDTNIKITSPVDLLIAEAYLNNRFINY
ncbi:MAG: 2-C-methyl-D-erythritol 4-phosphate cytidylyltransferase [Bacteroidota bacterium]